MQDTATPSPAVPPPAGPNRELMIIIGILLVGCCAIVGLGISGYFLFQNFQQNAQASATAQALTEQAIATQQAQATAAAKQAEIASYDFYDAFGTNSNAWFTGDEDSEFWRGNISVSDGTYIWNVLETKQPFIAWEGYQSQVSYGNFDVTVDVKREQGQEDLACYGLLFRESPTTNGFEDGAYTFSACDTQQFSVHYFSTRTDWQALIDWTDTTALQPGEWNTLGVHARGTQFTFLINGQEVGTTTDSHVAEGYVYPYIDMYKSATGQIRFDNFGIRAR